MAYSVRHLRSPVAIALGFIVSGTVAAWYLQFSPAGLIAGVAFAVVGVGLALFVGRNPN